MTPEREKCIKHLAGLFFEFAESADSNRKLGYVEAILDLILMDDEVQ